MPLIELDRLLIMILPILFVGSVYYKWTNERTEIAWATLRMTTQLLFIGYVLTYIFTSEFWLIGISMLVIMIIVAAKIVMRRTHEKTLVHYAIIASVIMIAGGVHLSLVLYAVIGLDPLYQPKFIIPIAGMIFANAMNVLSLFIDRFESERLDHDFIKARSIAFKAALIPQINTFLAVGLVSLPGMMTGQILSGVDPLIAVRYQIVVMAMILGSAGSSIILYSLIKQQREKNANNS